MYNFIDLFCGAGGFSTGLELAGFKCVGGIDNVDVIVKTHARNHKDSVSICGDIRKIEPEEFEKKLSGKRVDVIIGGPPCPTFSTIGDAKIRSVTGKPTREDPRNELFMTYLKYVEYFRPEIFVIENVPNFITKYKGEIFKKACEIISSVGKKNGSDGIYEIEPVQVLNAVYYGVPQTRRRMMLVAHKKKGVKFDYPKQTHYYDQDQTMKSKLKPCITVGDAIADLPKITDNWRVSEMEYSKFEDLTEYESLMRKNNPGRTVMNNICRMSNDRAKKVFPHMAQGSKYMDLPPEIRHILPFREDIFKDRLKRLIWDEPSWTVIAHIGMDGYMYIHPTENRTLSVREAARIQSFPDDFVFVGNQQETYVQVGNAVPPLLGKAMGKSLKKYMDTLKKQKLLDSQGCD